MSLPEAAKALMQNFQIYVIVALFLLSGLSALYRKIREKQAERAFEAARREQRDQELRTGRSMGSANGGGMDSAMAGREVSPQNEREQRAARQRREQEDRLRQLRERIAGGQAGGQRTGGGANTSAQPAARASSQGGGTSQSGGPRPVELWPGGPVVMVGGGAGGVGGGVRGGQGAGSGAGVPQASSVAPRPTTRPNAGPVFRPSQETSERPTDRAAATRPRAGQRDESVSVRPVEQTARAEGRPLDRPNRQAQGAGLEDRQFANRPQDRPRNDPARLPQRQKPRQAGAVERPTGRGERSESEIDRPGALALSRSGDAEVAAQLRIAAIRKSAALIGSGRIVPATRSQWRAALVGAEVLRPALSMREELEQ